MAGYGAGREPPSWVAHTRTWARLEVCSDNFEVLLLLRPPLQSRCRAALTCQTKIMPFASFQLLDASCKLQECAAPAVTATRIRFNEEPAPLSHGPRAMPPSQKFAKLADSLSGRPTLSIG